MALINIFSGQVEGFQYNQDVGVYFEGVNPSPFVIELGKTYKVTWDGAEYELEPFVTYIGENEAVAIGNRMLIGEADSGEPFAMAHNPTTDFMNFFAMSSEESHTIIVSTEQEEIDPDIVFPEQTINGFADFDGFFAFVLTDDIYILPTEGVTYTVTWDGVEYSCAAFMEDGYSMAIGNIGLLGGDDTGEPFLIVFDTKENTNMAYDQTMIVTSETDESHTLAIRVEETGGEEEPTEDVGVILKDRDGVDQFYYGVKGIKLDATDGSQMYFSAGYPEDGSISLDFSNGDILATPEKGKLWSSMAIPKPEGLVPENVLEGVEIGGVVGSYVTPKTEEKTVEADFSSGDMVVTPSEGKVLSRVNIPKPETLVAENIAEGVNVAGVVGTHSGGGGAVEEDYIQFFDYDGTLVQKYAVSQISGLMALPEAPVHEGLTFQGWNYSLEEIKEATEDTQSILHVGAMYITTDGKTRLHIKLEFEKDLALTMYYSQTVSGGVSVDWGDGSGVQTGSFTGNGTIAHTYANTGEYVIALDVVNGCVLGFGNGASGKQIFGVTGSSSYSDILTKVHIGRNVNELASYAFHNNMCMERISIPNGITAIGASVFSSTHFLRAIIVPNTVLSIGANAIINCKTLTVISLPNSITTLGSRSISNLGRLRELVIPKSVSSVTTATCQYLYSLDTLVNGFANSSYTTNSVSRVIFTRETNILESYGFNKAFIKEFIVPDGTSGIGSTAFSGCQKLETIVIPDTVTTIDSSVFSSCFSLKEIKLPSGLTKISNSLFSKCYSLAEIEIPDGVTSIGTSAFEYCEGLRRVEIPQTVTSLGNKAFGYCYSLKEIVLHEGLLTIGNQVFASCYTLSKLTIPSTVTTIGSYPFDYNHSLKEVHFLSLTPPTFSGALKQYGNLSKCTFYVPKGSLSAYQSATNMSEYSAQIVEE